MRFVNTFRGRLLLILALLLAATIGVQYYLNFLTQQENNNLREAQAQALVAGMTLGLTSITLKDYRVQDLVDDKDQTYFDEATRERIKDIITIDESWNVTDSLNPDYLPDYDDNGNVTFKKLKD